MGGRAPTTRYQVGSDFRRPDSRLREAVRCTRRGRRWRPIAVGGGGGVGQLRGRGRGRLNCSSRELFFLVPGRFFDWVGGVSCLLIYFLCDGGDQIRLDYIT